MIFQYVKLDVVHTALRAYLRLSADVDVDCLEYIPRTPAACSRTFSSFCLLRPATAHFRFPFGPSDTVRATSSTTNCPVNPEAPKITRW
ncbi:hypothetical protein EYF80_028975 [Liparis tanakae]|uniref:Uncharacterized protein n=1 Tax=Liparis tanakae TaxID=230148 RepID=A0A4Z2H6D3_9TELE|nr:hypothetical protein EYF80_028975 [Liparis tanakae]